MGDPKQKTKPHEQHEESASSLARQDMLKKNPGGYEIARKNLAHRRFKRAVQKIQLQSHVVSSFDGDSDEEEKIAARGKTKKEAYRDQNLCGRDEMEWSVFGGPTKKQQEPAAKPSLQWHKERAKMAARQVRTKQLAAPVHANRTDALPGPGAYDLNRILSFPSAEFRAALSSREAKALGRGKGARFSEAVVPTETEKLQRRAKDLPSPGQYNLPDIVEEQRRKNGGRFNSSTAKTALEWIEYNAKQTPGPGQYKLPDISEEQRRHGGGRFNESNPKTMLEIIERTAESIPGPGAYKLPVLGAGPAGGMPGAVAIGRSDRTSYIDAAIREAAEVPSAADYDAHKSRDALVPLKGGVKFSSTNHEHGTRAMLNEAARLPGPGQYSRLVGADEALKGGRFNTANPKNHTEQLCRVAAQQPGPGQYSIPRDRRAIRSRGTVFGATDALTDLDRQLLRAKHLPGPAQYAVEKATSIEHRLGGGKFNLATPLGPLDRQLRAAKQVPGPGQYHVTGRTRFGDGEAVFNSASSPQHRR